MCPESMTVARIRERLADQSKAAARIEPILFQEELCPRILASICAAGHKTYIYGFGSLLVFL